MTKCRVGFATNYYGTTLVPRQRKNYWTAMSQTQIRNSYSRPCRREVNDIKTKLGALSCQHLNAGYTNVQEINVFNASLNKSDLE